MPTQVLILFVMKVIRLYSNNRTNHLLNNFCKSLEILFIITIITVISDNHDKRIARFPRRVTFSIKSIVEHHMNKHKVI